MALPNDLAARNTPTQPDGTLNADAQAKGWRSPDPTVHLDLDEIWQALKTVDAAGGGGSGGVFLSNDVSILVNDGNPGPETGAGVAGRGSLCIDYTGLGLYMNIGSIGTPDWFEVFVVSGV